MMPLAEASERSGWASAAGAAMMNSQAASQTAGILPLARESMHHVAEIKGQVWETVSKVSSQTG